MAMTMLLHILGIAYAPLSYIVAIFIIAILTALAGFVLYSRREQKKRGMIIRLLIHLILSLGITLSVASYMEWVLWNMPFTVIIIVSLVVGIFVSVHAIMFYQSKKLTDDLNKKLKERYQD
jgi:cytochrome c biogenesis factor